MKLGIKVNADAESLERLSGADPALAEVWFNACDPDRYRHLFDELKRRHIDVGLHFWGIAGDSILPNLAYPDNAVRNDSAALMKKTIDIAAKNGFQYVNIHPGASALIHVDYTKERYDIISDPIDTDRSIGLFLESASELSAYANRKNVVFTVETVPPCITDGWYQADTRLTAKRSYELPARAIIAAGQAGISVANDFCHTAANCISDDNSAVWTYLLGTTEMLVPFTKLIHLGFVVPPYNGSDNHDMFTNPVFKTPAAVPDFDQTIQLLKLFRNRSDIWILAEPKEDHVTNYMFVKNMLNQAENMNSGSSPE